MTLCAGDESLGARPRYLAAATDGTGMLKGKVILTERPGSETVLNMAVGDGSELTAAIGKDTVLTPGTQLSWIFDPAQVHVLPETI